MEHAFTPRYLGSDEMSIQEDEKLSRQLSSAGRLDKFHLTSKQEHCINASENDSCYSSDSKALISRSTKGFPEAISSLGMHTDNANSAASLQDSPDKFAQTTKELYYKDFGFPHLSEGECNGVTPLASSSSGCLPEICKPETSVRPFASYSSRQTEELNARKNKQSKISPDKSSQDQVKQGHDRFLQNSTGPWHHLYRLAASVGSSRRLNGNSMEETGHGFKRPSFRGCNFDPQEQLGNGQNGQDFHAKMMHEYNETPNQLKLKIGLPQNSSDSKQPVQGSKEGVHVSVCNNGYHGSFWTNKSGTKISEGIRTKILSASGLSQFYVKESLNDNRSVAARQLKYHSNDLMSEMRNQKLEREPCQMYVEGNCKPSGTSSTHGSKLNLHRSMELNDVKVQNGIILRQWLGYTPRVVDKIENLHIFKQILELMEHAHSQGMLLGNICPSCFVLSSLNRIEFLESPASQVNFKCSKNTICPSSNPIDHSSKLYQNRKRSRQYFSTEVVQGHGHGDRCELPTQSVKPSATDNPHSEHLHIGVDATFQRKGSGSSFRTSSVDQNIGQACEQYFIDPLTEGNEDGKLLSKNAHNPRYELTDGGQVMDQSGQQCQSRMIVSNDNDHHSIEDFLLLEENWYTSPEQLNGGSSSFSSDVYSLGVLLFELFCTFTSWEEQMKVMSNLRHRILPSRFLSEHPKEAGFCLWLLHPDPSSRPKAREIVQSEFINEVQDVLAERQAALNVDEEDAETELLLDFLSCLKKHKQERASRLTQDVSFLMSDIEEVEKRRSFLMCGGPVTIGQRDSVFPSKDYRARDTTNKSQKFIYEDKESMKSDNNSVDRESSVAETGKGGFHQEEIDNKSNTFTSKGARLMKNFKHLEQVYFAMRGKIEPSEKDFSNSWSAQKIPHKSSSIDLLNRDTNKVRDRETVNVDRLGCFFDSICKYARYSRFEVRATLRHGDLLNTANVICSVSFDRDQEFFATAGVSKKIKVFGCDAVLNENVDIHYPAVEMASNAKLSSVCWNNYIKSYIASTDYDGIVQLWDASIGQKFTQYSEHQKRAWSVDFSQVDPTKLASGSDDCTVKLWSINQENSIGTIKTAANVCCVQFPPDSANMITFGSADYKIYCYDLRNTKMPWCTLAGHGKAVSYVKFIDSSTIVSASTDNTLKLWDLTKTNSSGVSNNACTLTFTGHTNEKNFVGLSVVEGYIACGSETNSVFAYYKSLPMPMGSHRFGFADPISGQEMEDDSGQFVSSICWRGKSKIMVAANSTGNIKLLEMV